MSCQLNNRNRMDRRGISNRNNNIRYDNEYSNTYNNRSYQENGQQSSIPELSQIDFNPKQYKKVHRYGGEFVRQLTPDQFNEFVEENPDNLIAFHSPECGHCVELEPHYAKAAALLNGNGSNIHLAAMDMLEYPNFREQHDINGYPTLRSYWSPSDYDEFKQDRTPNNILNYVRVRQQQRRSKSRGSNSNNRSNYNLNSQNDFR